MKVSALAPIVSFLFLLSTPAPAVPLRVGYDFENGIPSDDWTVNAPASLVGGSRAIDGSPLDLKQITDGVLDGDITGSDRWIASPEQINVNLDTAEIGTVEIRMKNRTAATSARFFRQEENGSWFNGGITFSVPGNDTAFQVYEVDLSSEPAWTGTVSRIRLDPAQDSFAVQAGDGFSVDYIQFR